jgi:hypothetical protein avisC_05318
MNSRDLGADEAFARAEEMVRVWLAEQGGERIEVEINGLGESESYDLRMVRNGRRERVYYPGDFFSALGRVRKAQFVRGRGAWTWSRLWMDVSDGVLHQECDWVRVPMYSYNLPSLVACKKEMDLFPRDEELLPDWLREGAERWRTELVPVAADEEAERAAREAELARLVDVSRRRAAAEVEAAWGRAVEGLLGGGVLRLPSGTVDGVVSVSKGVGLVRAWAELGWLASTEAAFGLCERLGWVRKARFDIADHYWTAVDQDRAGAWVRASEITGLFYSVKIALSEYLLRVRRGDPVYKEYLKALSDVYGEPVGRRTWRLDNGAEVALSADAAQLSVLVRSPRATEYLTDDVELREIEGEVDIDFDDPALYIRAPSEARSEVVRVDGDVLEWS